MQMLAINILTIILINENASAFIIWFAKVFTVWWQDGFGMVSGGSRSIVFIMGCSIIANCYNDLIKVLITSQPIAVERFWRCRASRARVTNRNFRPNSIRKLRIIYLLALCHIVAFRQSIIVAASSKQKAVCIEVRDIDPNFRNVCAKACWCSVFVLCHRRDAIISCSRREKKSNRGTNTKSAT